MEEGGGSVNMEYFPPASLSEALSLLKKWRGKARIVAGCTNMIPDMRSKAVKAEALIDVSHLKNLSFIKEEKKRIRIGGLTPIADLASSKMIQKYAPILSEAARQLGNPLVRNRATIGGNLADASPAADTAVPLLVLEATVVTDRERERNRQIPIDRLFVGPNKTILKSDEMIKEVTFSKPDAGEKCAYAKLGLRNAMAISLVSVAVLLQIEGGECKKARIGLGAVASKPMRAYRTEDMLIGGKITESLMRNCCQNVEREISPISDVRASAEYRRSMASVLFRRLIQQLISEGTR
jgi:CO/xanthine dehydrogenase FAD-binding subunit